MHVDFRIETQEGRDVGVAGVSRRQLTQSIDEMVASLDRRRLGELVVSAIGHDKVGLASSLFGWIRDAGGWVKMAKHAVLLSSSAFLVDIIGGPEITRAGLIEYLDTVNQPDDQGRRLDIAVTEVSDAYDLPGTRPYTRANFYAVVDERPGVLADFAELVTLHGCWIDTLTTYVVTAVDDAVVPDREAPHEVRSQAGERPRYGVIDVNMMVPDGVDIDTLTRDVAYQGRTPRLDAYVWDFIPSQPTRKLLPELKNISRLPGEVAALTFHGDTEPRLVAELTRALANESLTIVASMLGTLGSRTSMVCMLQPATEERCGTAGQGAIASDRSKGLATRVERAMSSLEARMGKEYEHGLRITLAGPFPETRSPSLLTVTAYSTNGPSDLVVLTGQLAKCGANIVQLVADSPRKHSRRIDVDIDLQHGDRARLKRALSEIKDDTYMVAPKGVSVAGPRDVSFTSIRLDERHPLWLDVKEDLTGHGDHSTTGRVLPDDACGVRPASAT